MSRRRPRQVRSRLAGAFLAALLLSAGAVGFVVAGSAAAQEAGPGTEVRIVARIFDSGKIEFGLQQRRADTTWGERQLPEGRLFPADAAADRWLWSEELDLGVAVVRITARRLPDGDVEFGLQQRGADDAWGERLLPTRRFFPAEATVGEWLPSSSLDLGTPGDPEVTDPLGLVAGYEFATAYSLGRDVWEVWLCDTPPGELFSTDRDVRLNPDNYADVFAQRVGPWFAWQSGGAYEPVFRAGGLVTAPEAEPAQCEEAVAGAIRSNDADGVLIVAAQLEPDTDGILGYGWCGLRSRRSWPDSGRSAVVYPGAFGHPTIVAHELGHTLCWPHSYTGSTLTDGEIGEYDNVMDQMSGARGDNPASANDVPFPLTIGTIAFNRYAAGWIDPAEVAIHEPGTTADYDLAPPGEPGTQMLVLPDPETGTDGIFAVLGARVRGAGGEEWHDSSIPAEGVEFYWIDQTHEGCRLPDRGACSGLDRRTVPIDAAPYGTGHVVGADGVFWTISGHEVTVGEPSDETGSYPVTVRPIDVLAWHYHSRTDSGESEQEDLDGATGAADEDGEGGDPDGATGATGAADSDGEDGENEDGEDGEEAARPTAVLLSGEQDFGSKYGAASLNMSCSEGLVDLVLYSWNDYIDRDVARGAVTARAADVTYRFGEESDPQQARWPVTGSGQGARAPAAILGELVGGLLEQQEPLHVTVRAGGGTEVGSATFPVPTDTGAIERVLADCGAEPAGPIPASDWTSLTDESDLLEGPLPFAVLASFEHDLPVPFHLTPARLSVECVNRRPTVSITLGGMTIAAGSGEQVRVAHRFDGENIVERDWQALDSARASMSWHDARGFLSDLQDHDRLVVRVREPAGQALGTVTFAGLAGAAEAIQPVLGACR